jgi:hypothetical protein
MGGEGRHPHALMRDTRHDDATPVAGDAKLCGFRLPAGNVELRPRKPVWPLRHRRFVPRKTKPAKLFAVFVVDTNGTELTIPFGN